MVWNSVLSPGVVMCVCIDGFLRCVQFIVILMDIGVQLKKTLLRESILLSKQEKTC